MPYEVTITYPQNQANIGDGPATLTKTFGTEKEAEMYIQVKCRNTAIGTWDVRKVK